VPVVHVSHAQEVEVYSYKKIAAEVKRRREEEQERQSMQDFRDSFPSPTTAAVQLTMREALTRHARGQ
jgi:hypothetical protein